MKEGDLITTYFKGFFRLIRIERRFYTERDLHYTPTKTVGEEYSPLYHFVQEYDSNGNPKTSKEKACDAAFCQLASETIKTELIKMKEIHENYLKILKLSS